MASENKTENVVPMKAPAVEGEKKKPAAKAVKKKSVKRKAAAPKAQKPKKRAISPNAPGTTPIVKKAKKKPALAKNAAKKNLEKKSVAALKSEITKKSKPQKPNILQFETMEKTMTQNTQQFDAYTKEATEFGRQSMDAAMKSGTIFAKGLEDIMKASMAYAQSAAEKQAEFAQKAMSSKTLNEWSDLQSKAAQSSFDDFMAEATKISELAVKTLSEASEPMNEQVNKAVNAAHKAA